MCACIDALERAGRDVELVYVEYQYESETGFRLEVPIKKAGEQFDLDRMAFCFANPNMHRSICFAVKDLKPIDDVLGWARGRNSGEWCSPTAGEIEQNPDTAYLFADNDSRQDCNTLDGAVIAVKKQLFRELKRIGVMN